MMLWSLKLVLPIILIVVVLGHTVSVLHWNHDKTRCFAPKHFSEGSWHTLFAIGREELRYKDKNWDCDAEWKLDPSQYKDEGGGNIVPLTN